MPPNLFIVIISPKIFKVPVCTKYTTKWGRGNQHENNLECLLIFNELLT